MSTDATIATVGGADTTATASSSAGHRTNRCYNCRCYFRLSITSTANFRCPGCRRIYVQSHYSVSPTSTPSNPNPNPNPSYPSISIYGPFAPNSTTPTPTPTPTPTTPLHSSDYIDANDEELFNSILDRTATTNQSPPTSKWFINSLPIVKITGSKSCAICKDDFECDEKANQLPCEHVFHHECIVPWLNQSNSCPLCRHKLPTKWTPKPLRLYVVRLGKFLVEGWGVDHESAFHEAFVRNRLFSVLNRLSSSSSSSPSSLSLRRIRRAQMRPVMVDEDGDTVMFDA